MPKQHREKKSKRTQKRATFRPSSLRESRSAARVGPITAGDETDVKLQYVYSSYMTNAGGGSTGKEWTPNAAYDVDPSLGSTATNGFDAYALLYSYYRVYGYRYDVEIVNRESDAVVAYLYNTNVSVVGSSLDIYAANRFCKTAQLGRAEGGSNSHRFSGYVPCSELLGSVEAETDATTRAVVTGVPTDLLFCSLFVQANNATGTLANGVSYIVKITMDVRFYGRVFYSSTSAMRERAEHLESARVKLNEAKNQKLDTYAETPAVVSASVENEKPDNVSRKAETTGQTNAAQNQGALNARDLLSILAQLAAAEDTRVKQG